MATTRMVALLRGINVGKAKRIAMADLRAMLESLGYTDVKTLLNSGNAIFSAADTTPTEAAERIEAAIIATFGFASRTTILTAAEVAQIIAEETIGPVATNHSQYMIAILNSPPDHALLEPLLTQDWAPEVLTLGTRVAYVWCHNGLLISKAFEAVSRIMRDTITTRNWATMLKIQAMM
jgi:uncharacterized protein (DUF1697 family)